MVCGNCFAQAFILAAATEELCKYGCLKFLTWKHPAFNYRFDGVVYSTAVAIGFDVIENLLYLVDSTADTAFIRAAFRGTTCLEYTWDITTARPRHWSLAVM